MWGISLVGTNWAFTRKSRREGQAAASPLSLLCSPVPGLRPVAWIYSPTSKHSCARFHSCLVSA